MGPIVLLILFPSTHHMNDVLLSIWIIHYSGKELWGFCLYSSAWNALPSHHPILKPYPFLQEPAQISHPL